MSCWVKDINPKQKYAIEPTMLIRSASCAVKYLGQKQPFIYIRFLKTLPKQVHHAKTLRPVSKQILFHSQTNTIATKP